VYAAGLLRACDNIHTKSKVSRALLFLVCAITLAAVIFLDFPGGLRISDAIQNWAHAPAFAVLALGFLRAFRGRYWLAGAAAVALGIAVEIVQYFLDRDADPLDVLQDTLGVVAALALHAAWFRPRSWLLRMTAAIAIAWAFVPLAYCAAAYWHRSQQFPVLVDFQSPLDLYFLRRFDPPLARVNLPAQFNEGPPAFTVFAPYGEHPWPGVVFEEPPADWSGYRTLAIDVANPNLQTLQMILTVHDRKYDGTPADRFDRVFTVPARQRFVLRTPIAELARAPRNRAMDLTAIWRMAIAQRRDMPNPQPGFFLNRVWLE
jgi:hypothetical protein